MEDVRKDRCQTRNNQMKEELFGVRNQLSYDKIVFRKFISRRNGKKKKISLST